MIKTGTRLKSQVCDTEIIVVKTGDGLDDLRAGGVPMRQIGADAASDAVLERTAGVRAGKPSDSGLRFLNREVNELLADLEN